ncbi:MAG: hypothetical protein ACNA7Y_01945 [Gammaproteobacteria bacterium]
MSFSDPWAMLVERHKNNTLPHAMLLVNASDFGLRFAKYIGKYFEHLTGSESIKIDDIRALIQFSTHTSRAGEYKVILIENAERMNLAASNALLKILEEPPGQTIILLTTDHPYILLPTIRSRCQILRCELSLQEAHRPMKQSSEPPNEQLKKEFKKMIQEKGDFTKIYERWAKLDQTILIEQLTCWVMDLIRMKPDQRYFIYLDRLYDARRCLLNHQHPNTQLVLETLFI